MAGASRKKYAGLRILALLMALILWFYVVFIEPGKISLINFLKN